MSGKIKTLRKLLKEYCNQKNQALQNLLFPDDGYVPGLDDGKWTDKDIMWIGLHLSLRKNDLFACPHCLQHAEKKFVQSFSNDHAVFRFNRKCDRCEYANKYGKCGARGYSKTGQFGDQYALTLDVLQIPSIVHYLNGRWLKPQPPKDFLPLFNLVTEINDLAYELWNSPPYSFYPSLPLVEP